ncbi:MAG: MMPL family transporter, partial [Bacteroidales bacterium]|nr:MMPL family transporter [Bacteroidales bacterium]
MTVALAAVCAVLIPKVNVNSDMSLYLPDNSPMKQGMKQMSESLPLLDQHMRLLSVMLTDADLRSDAPAVLDSLTGHLKLDSVREKDNLTLYRFNITSETDTEAVEERILEHYGDKAVVEVDGENLVMGGIGTTIFTGFVLIFIVLIIMCRSLMEVLLFLVTTGIAVLLNMGTNYFLGTVSLSTHSLVALLQMVLSMDYSIIIMNRYREEKTRYDSHPQAMAAAIRLSARTILSSALTTFVGLVMLVFLRLKIGADLG